MDIEVVFTKLSTENEELLATNDQLVTENEELRRQLEQLTNEKNQALDWYYDLCKENTRLVEDISKIQSFQKNKWLQCPYIHPYQKPCSNGTSCEVSHCNKWHRDSFCIAGHRCSSLSVTERNYHYEQVLIDNPNEVCPNFHPCQIKGQDFECIHGSNCRDANKKACINYHSRSMCPRGDSCDDLHSFWKKVVS